VTKLIVAFRNFAEEPKIENVSADIHLGIYTYTIHSKSSEYLGRYVNTCKPADIGAYRTARSKGQIARYFCPQGVSRIVSRSLFVREVRVAPYQLHIVWHGLEIYIICEPESSVS